MSVRNPSRLKRCFIEWMQDCCKLTDGKVEQGAS